MSRGLGDNALFGVALMIVGVTLLTGGLIFINSIDFATLGGATTIIYAAFAADIVISAFLLAIGIAAMTLN